MRNSAKASPPQTYQKMSLWSVVMDYLGYIIVDSQTAQMAGLSWSPIGWSIMGRHICWEDARFAKSLSDHWPAPRPSLRRVLPGDATVVYCLLPRAPAIGIVWECQPCWMVLRTNCRPISVDIWMHLSLALRQEYSTKPSSMLIASFASSFGNPSPFQLPMPLSHESPVKSSPLSS